MPPLQAAYKIIYKTHRGSRKSKYTIYTRPEPGIPQRITRDTPELERTQNKYPPKSETLRYNAAGNHPTSRYLRTRCHGPGSPHITGPESCPRSRKVMHSCHPLKGQDRSQHKPRNRTHPVAMRVVNLAYAVHALVTEPRLEGVRPGSQKRGHQGDV